MLLSPKETKMKIHGVRSVPLPHLPLLPLLPMLMSMLTPLLLLLLQPPGEALSLQHRDRWATWFKGNRP
jgi:hypothetical protein